MMAVERFPEAEWLGNGVSYGPYLDGPFKIVLHTTETVGIPSYNNGGSAPHVTYSPRERKFYQHTALNVSAGALRNEDGGVQTNKDSAIQLEIECYSAEWVVDQYGGGRIKASQVSEECLQDIGRWVAFVCKEFGVKPELFYPEEDYRDGRAYGIDSPTRMSGSVWDSFDGVCAHRNVPENTHWDTGALNNERIIEYAKEYLAPIEEPKEEETEMAIQEGAGGNGVTAMQRALNNFAKLNDREWRVKVDGTWNGTWLTQRVKEFQRAINVDETGILDGLTASFLLRYDPPPVP